MNGLSIGTSSGAKKSKNIMNLPPVVIKDHPIKKTDSVWMKFFFKSETADEQLSILKKELDNVKDPVDTNIIKFLVVVFFHSEAKHPIKCFLTRHVTRTKHIQETFVGLLTSEITLNLKHFEVHEDVINYKDIVFKIGMCLENFPAGTHAVNGLAEKLIPYLIKCLSACIYSFRNMNNKLTDKNAICSVAHLALNILLHLITKIPLIEPEFHDDEPVVRKLVNRFHHDFQNILCVLLHDKEVPMDTKTLCGLVLFSVECMMFSSAADAWKILLREEFPVVKNDEVRLAWYSAIVTTVPIEYLQMKLYNEQLAPISVIVPKLMDIVERNASEGVLVIGVARSLLHLSKQLPCVPSALGLSLAAPLLAFVWPHLDHFLDSVRHLAADLLTAVLRYCAHLRELCNAAPPAPVHLLPKHLTPEWLALDSALAGLAQLGPLQRGYYAGVRGVVSVLGAAATLRAVAPLSCLLAALLHRHLTSTVAGTLDMLVTRHSRESDAAGLHAAWLEPILRFVLANLDQLAPDHISVLDNLLVKAVSLNQKLSAYILPHIKQACESPDYELKDVLSLLRVTRGCLANLPDAPAETQELWGGVLPYDILKEAVVDAQEEVRVAGLALACGGAGRGCTRGELAVLLHYLAHCGREPDAHVAQQARAMLDKFAKRLFDGFRAAKRNNDEEKCQMYRDFDDQLRRQCYCALQPRASHSRRATALQLLQTLEPRPLEHRTWKPVYVDRLLMHLDDSYETNKALALEILQHVPLELLKDGDYSVSLKLEHIVQQAGSLRPLDCVSAAYKLRLLRRRLPALLLQGKHCDVPEAGAFIAIQALLASLQVVDHVLHMPRDCPAYGVLHCIAALLECLDPAVIRGCFKWMDVIEQTSHQCCSLLSVAEQVVSRPAPEGAMPADCHFTDTGNNVGVYLEDDRLVTAQMVLLCAWRTVKEATAVLGVIGAQLSEPREQTQLAKILAGVLVSARHRGAIEQTYTAYARVVRSMWRETDPMWKVMPPIWLSEMLTSLGTLTQTADRRSAGLPFLIQALVSTEENAGGPGSALHDVMRELLRLADAGAEAGAEAEAGADAAANRRAHACNILRMLYKDASLDTAVQSYVGEGLRVALNGFRRATWAERNSSTLLLSALMTRVFGVTRNRGALSARNRMTGRVFYLRYPALYDIMLNELKEASESEEKLLLCPSLYPVLLLLGRLYPSSLEGTESNLKLVSFVPYVVSCARSRVLHTRRLAASACVPLIAPDRYVAHVHYLLTLVSDARIERNYCHGLLLQICALLDHKPEGVDGSALAASVQGAQWIVHQAPMCYPLLHQYVLVLSALIARFPENVRQATLDGIAARLHGVVFPAAEGAAGGAAGAGGGGGAAPGRELCLAACLRLLLARPANAAIAHDLIVRGVQHEVHAVSDAACECLLALWGRGGEAEGGCQQPEDGASVPAAPAAAADARAVTDALRSYMLESLRGRALWRRDPRRARLYLEVLVCAGSQELASILPPALADSMLAARHRQHCVPYQLRTLVQYAPQGATHLYVEAFINYMVVNMESLHESEWKLVYWMMSGEGRGARREVVARALGENAARMLEHAARAEPRVALVIESCVFVSLSLLLRAGPAGTRALAARAALPLTAQGSMRCVVAGRSAELLLKAVARRQERALALLIAMAMYHIQPVGYTDSPNNPHPEDECRVFDNEIENVYDEEEMWVVACADEVVDLCAREGVDPVTQLSSCLDWRKCNLRFDFSFDSNVILRVLEGNADVLNPLVEVFVKRLKRENLDE